MKYHYLDDLTSDVMFESFGITLKELFENSALAMSEVICDMKKVKPEKKITVEVDGDGAKDLLFNWLQEIIAEIDIESMFFSEFDIISIDEKHLKADLYGEDISREKGNTVVKAVTNYKFTLKKDDAGYRATAALDI